MAVLPNDLALLVFAATLCGASPTMALDPRYPDWPCQQLKVPGISPVAFWNGPSLDSVYKERLTDPKSAELVARLVARRTPMEQARKLIEAFVVGSDAEKQVSATALFAQLYSVLNSQRDEVMNGIERFSRKEKDMAAEIRAKTQEMQRMEDGANADQAAIDQLATQLAWETRIFEDRQRSLSYVCEVPVLIEKRLFDLGRLIEEAANFDAQPK